MTSYEQNRLENIKRNKAILEGLGLDTPSIPLRKKVKNTGIKKRKLSADKIVPREKSVRIKALSTFNGGTEIAQGDEFLNSSLQKLEWKSYRIRDASQEQITTVSVCQATSKPAWVTGHEDGSLQFCNDFSRDSWWKRDFTFSSSSFAAHKSSVSGSVFVKDKLFSAAQNGEGKLWDVTGRGLSQNISTFKFGRNFSCLTAMSNNVTIGKSNGYLQILDVSSPKSVKQNYKTPWGGISLLDAHPTQEYIAVCARRDIHLYDTRKIKGAEPVDSWNLSGQCLDMKFTPDGEYLAAVTRRGTVEVLHMKESWEDSMSSGNGAIKRLKGNICFLDEPNMNLFLYPDHKGIQIFSVNETKDNSLISRVIRRSREATIPSSTFLGFHRKSKCIISATKTGNIGLWKDPNAVQTLK